VPGDGWALLRGVDGWENREARDWAARTHRRDAEEMKKGIRWPNSWHRRNDKHRPKNVEAYLPMVGVGDALSKPPGGHRELSVQNVLGGVSLQDVD